MNQRKYEAWAQFAYNRLPAFEVALRMLDTPFTRKDLGKDYHVARDLVRACLLAARRGASQWLANAPPPPCFAREGARPAVRS